MTSSSAASPKHAPAGTTDKSAAPGAKGAAESADTEIAAGTGANTPAADGFYMPGEFEPHAGCIMIWPERAGSWGVDAHDARCAFREVIAAIAQSETVYVAAGEQNIHSALEMLFNNHTIAGSAKDSYRWDIASEEAFASSDDWRGNVEVFLAETDDAWARDIGPTFVVARDSSEEHVGKHASSVRAVNWDFNAWGGTVDGAYTPWDADNVFARTFCERYRYTLYDASPFVLEGGAIACDGAGTVLVTEACLLSKGRNPDLSREQIETKLKDYLGAQKIIWLPRGIYNDETNEHIDNMCAFLRPGEVALAWTDNENDPQYPLSSASLEALEQETDARGEHFVVHKLDIPDVPVCVSADDLAILDFAPGEVNRRVGERLAASYVNFYISNSAIVLPTFEGENSKSDERAIENMQAWCPDRTVIPVFANDILLGGGGIHCITQQIPARPGAGADLGATANAEPSAHTKTPAREK